MQQHKKPAMNKRLDKTSFEAGEPILNLGQISAQLLARESRKNEYEYRSVKVVNDLVYNEPTHTV